MTTVNKILSILDKQAMTLIVNIPEADADLAKAAQAGGCDALLLDYSEVKDNKSDVAAIIKSSTVPVGVSCGSEKLTEDQAKELCKMGFDFLEICVDIIPQWINKFEGIAKFVTLNQDYSAYDLTELAHKKLNAIDAAVISNDTLGKDLTVGDLQNYITIALSTGLPVLVPTQKMVRASEVPIIWDTGAKGIILNKMVIGETALTVKAVTKEFREEIEKLKDQ